jgi:hypothetical protein
MRHAANGECVEAAALADFVIQAVPIFAPAYGVAYRCYLALGKPDIAVQRLDQILAILPEGPDREAIAQLRQGESAKHRPVFSGYATVSPSSNVNRQTAATTINGGPWGTGTIPQNARGQMGILLETGGSVAFHLGELHGLTATGVLRSDIRYSTATQTFEPRFTAELPLTFQPASSIRAAITPYVSIGFEDAQPAQTRVGAMASAAISLAATQQLGLSLGAARIERPLSPTRSGIELDGSISLASALDPNNTLTTRLRLLYEHTDDSRQRRLEAVASAQLDTLFASGLLTGLEGKIGQRYHSQPAPFVVGPNQTDIFVSARMEVSHRNLTIGDFMPTLFYQYSESWSDNVFYDYDSHDVGVTLKARF